MAGIRFTQFANLYMNSQRLTVHDLIEVIGEYETIEEDRQSGLTRVSKIISNRRLLVIYTAIEDDLMVIYVNVQEVSQ